MDSSEKMFKVLLIILVLIALYQCIQKHKTKNQNELNNSEKKVEKIIEKFNTDKIFIQPEIKPTTIKFDYGERPIDKQFLVEQEKGAFLSTWYPNTWIESLDSEGKPVYNSREKQTGVVETFIEPKARFSYEFNKEKTLEMGGIMDPDNFIDGKGKTLQEIYDNSFVNYKKLIPNKTQTSEDGFSTSQLAASSLRYFTPETWTYQNEKPENGGEIISGLYACDPTMKDTNAMFI